MQKGYIYQRDGKGAWHLRYRTPDGKQHSKLLVEFSDQYCTKRNVQPLARKFLQSLTEEQSTELTFGKFVEESYLPHLERHRRPSTFKGYKNIYHGQVEPHVKTWILATVQTPDVQRLFNTIADKETHLSRQTFKNIKNFLSGVFRFANNQGHRADQKNPVKDTETQGRTAAPTYAYSIEEVKKMLEVLDGTAHTAVVISALTGLSLAEMRGLQWEDIEADRLNVRRTVWHSKVCDPKTEARKAPVPLLPEAKKELERHHKRNPGTKWVFQGQNLFPIDLATLGSKTIKKLLKEAGLAWYGWHALRRGLGTTLYAQGQQDITIQKILRHSTVGVTQKHYIKPLESTSNDAMKKFGTAFKETR